MKEKIFIPLYIDKVKLFDINSIINGGFSEFNEISVSVDNNVNSEIKGKMGFNLFKLNGNVESGILNIKNKKVNENTKFIQTSASMLSNIYLYLNSNKKIKKNSDAVVGDIVELDINFNINSIVEYLKKYRLLLDFGNRAVKIDKGKKGRDLSNELKSIDSIIELVNDKSNIVEFVAEDDCNVYVAYLNRDYLYHTQLERIDGQKLKYLAQIINVTDEYDFCNDTVLSKFNKNRIDDFIRALKSLGEQDIFAKNMSLKTESNGKKIVILDIISICRFEN